MSAYSDYVISLAPVAYWGMDQPTSSGEPDLSGNGNDLPIEPGGGGADPPLVTTLIADPGGGARRQSTDPLNYRTFWLEDTAADPLRFIGTQAFSVAFWYQFLETGTSFYNICGWSNQSGTAGTDNNWAVFIRNTSGLEFVRKVSGAYAEIGYVEPTPRHGIHFFVATYDGATITQYLDGVFANQGADSRSMGTITAGVDFRVGGSQFGGNRFYGDLDEFAVFDYELQAEEVAQMYRLGKQLLGDRYERLAGPRALPTTAETLYTNPSDRRAEIRHVYVNNPTGGEVEVTLSIGSDAAGTRFLDQHPIAAGESFDARRPTHRTLDPEDIIQGFCDTAGVVVVLDGYLTPAT